MDQSSVIRAFSGSDSVFHTAWPLPARCGPDANGMMIHTMPPRGSVTSRQPHGSWWGRKCTRPRGPESTRRR